MTYTLAVTNSGPDDAVPVVMLNSPIPSGLTLAQVSGPCAGGFPCTLGPLNAGGRVTVQVTLQIPAGYAGPNPIMYSAAVSSPTPDPAPSNNTARASTQIVAGAGAADLAVTQTGPGHVAAGNPATYTLVVTNHGPGQATGVVLDDPTPAGLTFAHAMPPCASGFPCTLETIGAGASVSVAVTFDIPAPSAGPNTVMNTATVMGNEAGSDNTNNRTSLATGVNGSIADMHLTLHGPASVRRGATITYTLVVTNTGPSRAAGVVLSDVPPAGLVFISASAPCDAGLPCPLGDLSVGSSTTVSVTYQVPLDFAGPISLVYQSNVMSATNDPNTTNNTATVSTPVETPPVAMNATVTTIVNTAATLNVLGNSSDADGDPLTVTSVTQPAHGTVVLNSDGTVMNCSSEIPSCWASLHTCL